MRRLLPLLAFVAACAPTQSPAESGRMPGTIRSASPHEAKEPPPAPDAGNETPRDPDAGKALESDTCAALAWASGSCLPRLAHATPAIDDVPLWFTQRGALAPNFDIMPECHEARVGVGQEEALVCEGIVHVGRGSTSRNDSVYRVAIHLTVHVVRNKRAAIAFDAPILVDVLDKEEPGGPLFALEFAFGKSGELRLSEPTPGACQIASKRLDEHLASARAEADPDSQKAMSAWASFDREMLKKICKGAGDYVFQNGRFSRKKPPPVGSSSSGP